MNEWKVSTLEFCYPIQLPFSHLQCCRSLPAPMYTVSPGLAAFMAFCMLSAAISQLMQG